MTAKERAVVEAARCVALDAQYGYTVSVHDAAVRGHVMEALRVALRDLDAQCEACGGSGEIRASVPWLYQPCPACGGGR